MSSPPRAESGARPAGPAPAAGPGPGRGAALRAYIALTKPRIIWLLLITTVPAMVVAAGGWPDSALVASTLLGGMLAAGGANAINQYADRDIDRLMSRTRGRPLVQGVVPPGRAAALGLVLSAVSVAWLALAVNPLAAALTAAAIVFYVLAYTYFLKRTTTQNIVIGGAAGAAPPVIGWAAVTATLEIEAALLFLVVFYWTPPHFWALSLLLADDYERAGVPMLPVVRGEAETKRQILLYTLLLVPLTLIFGAVAEMRWLYFATAALGGSAFIALALALGRRPGIDGARPLFRYSVVYLAVLFASMAADRMLLG